jgi:hypothetical protein
MAAFGGIKQDDNSVAFKEIIISPSLLKIFHLLKQCNSLYGTIKSSWNKVDGRFELRWKYPLYNGKGFIPANSIDDIIESGKTIKIKAISV